MFNRFTERARKVVFLAKEEAIRLGHNYIGTEHLLLGLIKEGSGVAATALLNLGKDLNIIKTEVEKAIPTEGGTMTIGEISFTPRAKRVLELAVDEAREMEQNFIGTEQLLLALLRENEGIAANVFTLLGIDYEKVKTEIMRLFEDSGLSGHQQTSKGKTHSLALEQFGRDLTALAKEHKLDPVIGRVNEIERIIQILSRRTKNNPVLIGDSGVGKTAVVEGLAQKIVERKVPEVLYDKRVFTLELASIVAGTKYRGQFEERMKVILNELQHLKNVILFIDEIHTLVGAGSAEGALDASSILKPALSRGEIQCIGATTLEDYRKYIEKDGALERRFQTIMISEPTLEETILILKGLRDRYEAHHKVKYTDNALEAATKLSDKYITGRFLPDKAIDLIDEAGSRVKLNIGSIPPDELKKIEQEIDELYREKEATIQEQDFEKAAKLRDSQNKLKKKQLELKKKWEEKKTKLELIVTEEDIAFIVSKWTGIPVIKLEEKETEKLLKMPEELHRRIINQEEAVDALCRAIQRSRAGLKDPKRPIGSFIFAGPTGVGKTELAKALAEFLFGDENALVQIDMSEYMEKFAISRLVGAPPGYIGYDEAGQLTEKIRRRPYSVVLLDDIDKAHPGIFDMMLQVLEEGRLTDSTGRIVNFRNTVIIMTTNIGMDKLTITGFGEMEKTSTLSYETIKRKVQEGLKERFKAEFRNRIDETIVFYPLTKIHIGKIVELFIKQLQERLKEKKMEIELTSEAKELLIEKGYDPQFGARPMRRTIQRYLEDTLSEEMLKGRFKDCKKIIVKREGDNFIFEEKK